MSAPPKTRLAISCGDPNGIGIEVALRAFADPRLYRYVTPVLFASLEMAELHREACGLDEVALREATLDRIDPDVQAVQVVRCWEHEPPVEFGRVSPEGGAVAKTSLEHAAEALRAGQADALVTAPIHKSAMQQAGFGYPGHTEYLEHAFGDGRSLMLMVGDDGLRVALATNHVPLKNVANAISPTILQNKIALLEEALRRDFGIVGPSIAVLALNPHAGDGGAIGTEEEVTIRPAVEAMKRKGVDVMGPYPADGFFGSGNYRNFDGILAMYHDQGLVPFKTLAFGGGVNFTAGLSVVRTSPDHGTALDIAGQGRAGAASFTEAVFAARQIHLARAGYDEAHANPIKIRKWDRKRGGGGGKRNQRRGDDVRPHRKEVAGTRANEDAQVVAPERASAAAAKTAQPAGAPRSDNPTTGRPADAGSAPGGHPEGTPPEA